MINNLKTFDDGLNAIESCFSKTNPKSGILSLKFESALITITVTSRDGVVAGIMSQDFGSDHYRLAPGQHFECLLDWLTQVIEWQELNDEPEVIWFDLYSEEVDKEFLDNFAR